MLVMIMIRNNLMTHDHSIRAQQAYYKAVIITTINIHKKWQLHYFFNLIYCMYIIAAKLVIIRQYSIFITMFYVIF